MKIKELKEWAKKDIQNSKENPNEATKEFIIGLIKYLIIGLIALFILSRGIYYEIEKERFRLEDQKGVTEKIREITERNPYGETQINITDGFDPKRYIQLKNYNIFTTGGEQT